MNKEELIKKYKDEFSSIGMNLSTTIKFKELWIDILELDEPQKVKVPQFVADFITEQKKLGHTLSYSIDACMADRVAEWYWDNSELFARAWLDGYQIEQYKKYLVQLRGVKCTTGVLKCISNRVWYMGDDIEYENIKVYHTEEELKKAGFGGVFGNPVFEVVEESND